MGNQLSYSMLFCTIFITAAVFGEHAGTRNGRAQSPSSSGTTNCLAELNAEQLQILNRVRALTGQHLTNEELAKRTLDEINRSALSDNGKGALAALAFGELNRAKRLEMQDPNGEFKSNVQNLIRFGARSTAQGLDLSGLDLSRLDQFKADLETLFPESKDEISKLNEVRNTPIVLGNYIVLGRSNKRQPNTGRIMTLDEYKKGVSNYLQIIRTAFRNYQEDSNEAGSTSNLISAIWRSGPSDAERREDRSYNHLIRTLSFLETHYGYPSNKMNELRSQVQSALRQANSTIDRSLTQVYWAAGAIAAAPLAWPIVAIGGTTAAIGMGTSLAFTAVDTVASATIDTIYGNGNLACNLGKQLLEKGPQGMVTALAFGTVGAALPGAARLTGEALRRIVGPRTLQGIALTAQGALMAPGLYHTGAAFFSASDLEVLAQAAEADGDTELANEYRRLAARARSAGTQGLASSIVLPVAARYMSQSFTFNQEMAERLLGRTLSRSLNRAMERAHRIGEGELGRDRRTPARIGNYTDQQLQNKYSILAEAGLSKNEIKTLMDAGVVGRRVSEYTQALARSTGEPHEGYHEFKNYNDAMTTALKWLKDRGFSGSLRDFSPGDLNRSANRLPNVLKVRDEAGKWIQVRIEVHPVKNSQGEVLFNGQPRAHVNVSIGKEDGPHFLFPGDQRDVDAILRQLLPTFGR